MLEKLDKHNLLELYDSAAYLGVMLVGSSASGQADRYSDIDLIFYAPEYETNATAKGDGATPDAEYSSPDSPAVTYWQDRLVSRTLTSITRTMESFSDPEAAINNIEGLRKALILRDTASGALLQIQRAAIAFDWSESLIARAESRACHHLASSAEEVNKIIGALERRDFEDNIQKQGRLLAGLLGLTLTLPRVIALKYRILSRGDNNFLSQIYDAVGLDSNWFYAYTRSLEGQLKARALAALELYETTSVLCLPFAGAGDNLDKNKMVIRETLRRIEHCLNKH